MPIYEYTCGACATTFEKLVRSMSATDAASADAACPSCGSSDVGRSMSVFAVSGGGEGQSSASAAPPPGLCGRCGGPGPCSG